MNEIKVICADLLKLKTEKDGFRKESEKLLNGLIVEAAYGHVELSTEMLKLKQLLNQEMDIMDEILMKIKIVENLVNAENLNQMEMRFKGEE